MIAVEGWIVNEYMNMCEVVAMLGNYLAIRGDPRHKAERRGLYTQLQPRRYDDHFSPIAAEEVQWRMQTPRRCFPPLLRKMEMERYRELRGGKLQNSSATEAVLADHVGRNDQIRPPSAITAVYVIAPQCLEVPPLLLFHTPRSLLRTSLRHGYCSLACRMWR